MTDYIFVVRDKTGDIFIYQINDLSDRELSAQKEFLELSEKMSEFQGSAIIAYEKVGDIGCYKKTVTIKLEEIT